MRTLRRIGFLMLLVLCMATVVSPLAGAAEKISFWSVGYNNANLQSWLTKEGFADFEKKTGIKVEYLNLDWNEYNDKVTVAAVGGTGPDVLGTGGDLGVYWGRDGIMYPLNRYLTTWKDKDSLIPGFLKPDEAGNIYGLPLWLDIRGTLYNKRIFREVGLNPNQGPQSWDEIIADSKRITKVEGGKLVRVGFDEDWSPGWGSEQSFVMFLYNAGGHLYSQDWKKVTWGKPEGVAAAEALASLYQYNHPAEATDQSMYDDWSGNRFVQGTTAMVHGGTWMAATALSAGVGSDLGFFLAKRYPNSTPGALSFTNGIGIGKYTKNPDAAWKFLEWLFSRDVNATFHTKFSSVSTRKDALAVAKDLQPELQPWYANAQYGVLWEEMPIWVNASFDWDTWGNQLADIYRGKLSARVLETTAQTWQAALDEAWAKIAKK